MGDPDSFELLRVFAALVFVLALMGGFLIVLRKLGYAKDAGNPNRRLKVIEVLPLDGKRKLVILQRDTRQHLVILSQNGETLIESGIESGQDATKEIL